MTSPSEHICIESKYCQALENDHKNSTLAKFEINHEAVMPDEKQKDFTLSNSPKQIVSTCCNLEKAEITDTNSSGFSTEGYGKESLAHRDGDDVDMRTEMHKHENKETSIFNGNKSTDLEIDQINNSIRSCIDVILENVSLTEKESELVNDDINPSNREKSVAPPEKGQVKLDGNCDTFGIDRVISSDEKLENINIREFCVSVTPLNTEVDNSAEQYNYGCFNSEKSGCNSVVVDINLKVVAIDGEKIERRQTTGNTKLEMQKHENILDTVSCGSNYFNQEVNVGTESPVDKVLEILSLSNNETNMTHDGISLSDREKSDEASQESRELGGGLEESERGNCNTFGVKATICLGEIQDDFNEPNIEINNSGKQNLEECCNSEIGNFNSENMEISSKNILIDHGTAEEKSRTANTVELEAQKDKTLENSVSGGSCVKNDSREVIEIKGIATKDCKKTDSSIMAYDAVSEAYGHQNIEDNGTNIGSCNGKRVGETNGDLKLCHAQLKVSEKNSKLEENDFIASNREKSVSDFQESCMLHKSTETNRTTGNVCVTFEINVDEKRKNSIRLLETDKQNGDLCKSLEKDNFNSDINIASLKDIEKKDCKNTDSSNTADNTVFEACEHQNIDDNGGDSNPYKCERTAEVNVGQSQLKLSEENNEIKENNDVSEKLESVIQKSYMLDESTKKDQARGDTIESNVDETRKNSIRVLDTNKQDADACKSSDDFHSNVNVKIILTEDHRKTELSETLEHQKSIPKEEKCFNGGISDINDKKCSCFDPVVENVNVKENESELVNNGITVNNREKCKTVYQKINILHNTIQNEKKLKRKTLEVTALTSKIETNPEDLDVIVISSTEEENYDFDQSKHISNEISGKNDLNADVLSRDKFHEELDNEVEILKAQYLDIEKKLTTAKKISNEEKYKCSLKVKTELTSCMQSLEKLCVTLKNKWLHDKSKIPKQQVQPSCSYHPEKLIETPIDKYRYRSQAFTRLTKISHHHYEFNSQMPPWETAKTSHKCKKRPENFSASEEEACKNLHKKKCASQYSFQLSPEKKIKTTSKKCCSSKNCTSYRKARETEFHSYSNELDCFGGRGGFSKSYIAHRELTFSKSNPSDYTNYLSYSNPTLKMTSPTDKYKSSVLKPCSRKKMNERRYEKGFNLHKYGRENDFNNDLSDSSEISSVSDRDFSPIHSDHYSAYGKHCKSKYAVKKNEVSSKREKPKKRIREKQYETDEISMSSIDSDISIELIETSGKRHKEKAHSKYNIENKRVHNLIGRQMDFINKHVSKKGDRIESTQASFTDSDIDEKYKKKYIDREKNNEEISSSEGTTPVLENMKKRKKKTSELPSKQAKISNHSDLRNILNNKHQSESCKVKFHTRSMSPVETDIRSPCKVAKTKLHTDSQNIFKNKHNTENSKVKLQSYIVSPSSNLSVDAMRYKNKDIDNYSTQTFGQQTKETKRRKNKAIGSLSTQSSGEQVAEHERKTSDDKHSHKFGDNVNVVQSSRNEGDEEYSEAEINNIKGMETFVSFLKKKKGKYLTPPFTMLINRELENEQEPKYRSDSTNEVKREKKLPQKSRTDLVYPENVSVKSKKTVHPPQISPKMTEQSATQRPVKKKFVEDKNDLSASSGKFDLFKQLNREIRKKNSKKSAPMASTMHADFENKKIFSKPSYPAENDAPFNKVKGFSTKFEGRESLTKSKDLYPDFQEDNGTWSD